LHDVNADDAAAYSWKPAGLYGNGWTNTFDAHIARNASGSLFTVFDVDGTHYDFTSSAGVEAPVPGNDTTLTGDGSCGFLWTKKSGTSYYFYRPSPAGSCTWTNGLTAGFAGRLYQIIGRNRNTYITFSYSWDNGDSSTSGKISTITATTESGMTALLAFADVGSHRLLQTLTYPDGVTTLIYGYDLNGNLTMVRRASNNAAGVQPTQMFGYYALGSGYVLQYAGSPRMNASCMTAAGCYADGGVTWFNFAGSSVDTSTLSSIQHQANVNPSIADGTNTGPIQGSASSSSVFTFLTEYYTTGVATPTFRDTDGHMTNWVVDGTGRPTQTQECTQSSGQGTQCTGLWLTTNETWDGNNNLTKQIDPRGGETDFAYDANGNTIAVAEPATTSSEGTFRPTRLYDYDSFSNVTAYCDQSETNQAGANWVSPPSPSDSLCSSHSVPHARFAYAYPSNEPNGELTTITTPLGYSRHLVYDAAKQSGADYGLPTSVSGDPITQLDGSTLTPSQSFWYDNHGSLRCYGKGVGTWVLAYDTDNRLTAVADPDDSSLNAGSLCGKTSGQSGWNTQTTTTYFPDGSKQAVQTPSERAFGVSTTYTYDLDGNVITETAHHGCVPGQTCPDGTTKKWYDGADRLVEVGLPQDPRSFSLSTTLPYDHPAWFTRYMYDLSQGGTVGVGASGPIRAYGNLYDTLVTGDGPGGWLEKSGSQFDALDREVSKYSWLIPAPTAGTDSTATLETTQLVYDKDATTLGLLAQKINPAGESVAYTYNAANKISSETYANDGARTANETYTYDATGRTASIMSSQFGTQSYAYDADGRLATSVEPNQGGVTDPAQIQYAYYANGQRSTVSVNSSTLNQPNALTYSYRADGLPQTQTVNAFASGSWSRQYTDGGRPLTTGGVDVRSRTYDTSGQLLSDTIRGNGMTFTHDPEGSVLIEAFPSFTSVATMNYTYDVRGELIDSHDGGSPPTDERLTWIGNCGSHITIPPNADSDLPYTNTIMDARSCAPIATGQINDVVYDSGVFPTGTTNKVTYDAAGRAVDTVTYTATFMSPEQTDLVPQSQNADGSGGSAMQNPGGEIGSIQSAWGGGRVYATSPRTVTTTKTVDTAYDAENHTVSRGGTVVRVTRVVNPGDASTPAPAPTPATTTMTTVLGWGPNGHPAVAYPGTTAAMTFHWDGDVILFVTDANGNVVDFKAGLDGEITPRDTTWTGLTVFDRDQGGMVIDTATPTQNLFDPLDSDGSPTQNAAWMVPQYAPYYRTDGFYVGDIQINGVRAVDPAVGAWTTPDAYEGDVHDPMSQQKYMFNRNNAIDYSDPAGYWPIFWDLICGTDPVYNKQRADQFASANRTFGEKRAKLLKGLSNRTVKAAAERAVTGTESNNGGRYNHLEKFQGYMRGLDSLLKSELERSDAAANAGDRAMESLHMQNAAQVQADIGRIQWGFDKAAKSYGFTP
jgi:YD repeat-containing protein